MIRNNLNDEISFWWYSFVVDLINVGLPSSNNCFNNIVPFALNHKKSWHSLDFISTWELGWLININFDKWNASLSILFQNIGSYSFAGATPCGMTINNCDSSVGVEEILDLLRSGSINVSHDKSWKYLL